MPELTESQLQAHFERACLARLEEVRTLWSAYAELRRLHFVARGTADLPALDGRAESTSFMIAAVGSPALGYRTRAVAEAKVPLGGRLRIGPHGGELWDDIAGVFRRRFFDDPELDRLLIVEASSRSFARTLLDARVVRSIRALAPAQLRLSYGSGEISLEWGGVERDFARLDDVVEVLGYLAVQGSETAPYR